MRHDGLRLGFVLRSTNIAANSCPCQFRYEFNFLCCAACLRFTHDFRLFSLDYYGLLQHPRIQTKQANQIFGAAATKAADSTKLTHTILAREDNRDEVM